MSDDERGRIDCEVQLAAPDWRVRAGPRKKPGTEGERRARSKHTYRSETGAHTA